MAQVYTYTELVWVCVSELVITGEHINQNQIWCVNIGEYMVFGVYRGF